MIFRPKFNRERPRGPEGNAEKKEYEPVRFGVGWKTLAALDVGMFSTLKEGLFASEKEWDKREQESESKDGWLLRNFIQKAAQGYQALEKTGEIIDEMKFQEVSAGYEYKLANAGTEGERNALREELEAIKRSREEKLAEEKRSREARNTVLKVFADIFKK